MFITASNKKLDLLRFNRLYAFPTPPILDSKHKIILDSGAFGLSKSGGKMDAVYMLKLAEHYKKYGNQSNVFCIAPDVFKSPAQSIKQYKEFMNKYNIKIAPVLQFKYQNIDLFDIKKQINEYSRLSNSRMVCISNNKFNPIKQGAELKYIVEKIRLKFDDVWIHVLGAGYSHNNVKDWMKLGVNSMDSISYYTDAQAGLAWKANSYQTEPNSCKFRELATHNAMMANK